MSGALAAAFCHADWSADAEGSILGYPSELVRNVSDTSFRTGRPVSMTKKRSKDLNLRRTKQAR